MNNSKKTNNDAQDSTVNSKTWKCKTIVAAAAVVALSMASCETTGEHKNLVAGSVIGVGVGALSGARSGNAGRNAAIGGVTGAMTGAAKDKSDKRKREAAERRKAEWVSKTPAERKRIAQNNAAITGAFASVLVGSALGGGSSTSSSELDRNTAAYYMPSGLGGNGAR